MKYCTQCKQEVDLIEINHVPNEQPEYGCPYCHSGLYIVDMRTCSRCGEDYPDGADHTCPIEEIDSVYAVIINKLDKVSVDVDKLVKRNAVLETALELSLLECYDAPDIEWEKKRFIKQAEKQCKSK